MEVARNFGVATFGYAVTPNVDHLIRYYDDPRFRQAYVDARFVLLDSRLLAYILRLTKGLKLKVCTGSDLTARLFSAAVRTDDRLVVVGGSAAQAEQLALKYGLRGIRHHNPPMGFIGDPAAVESCLEFIESHSPFRFCLLALGAPQQEFLAQKLQQRDRARGLVLCIGAALNFLTGTERRAPRWMQNLGLEWAFRLLQDPGRLARRYLVRGPRVFALLRKMTIIARPGVVRSR